MKIKRFCFKGNFHSMGLQHGESLRSLIRDLAEERIDIICTTHPKISCTFLQTISEENVHELMLQVPEVYKEVKGISSSSNIELWKLMIAGGFSDIEHRACDINGESLDSIISECTLLPTLNEFGNLLLAGTWDSHATAEKALVLIERRPQIGPATLALTTAGWPMQQGITSQKIGFAITNLVPKISRRGISYIGALPRIVSQTNIHKAVKLAVSLKLSSGRFYAICDSSANYFGIETDGKHYWTSNCVSAHTNHYIYEGAKSIEGRKNYRNVSEKRRLSAIKRLQKTNDISNSKLFKAISYNNGTINSISQNGIRRENRSCAGFVIDPTNLLILATKGPPHLSKPCKYYLEL